MINPGFIGIIIWILLLCTIMAANILYGFQAKGWEGLTLLLCGVLFASGIAMFYDP